MKKSIILLAFTVVAFCWVALRPNHAEAQTNTFRSEEYVTIRWDGQDNTHVIRPNGRVESLGPILMKVMRPNRADSRAFYMNVAMNAVAKEGFEFAGMTEDQIVMRRQVENKP